MAAGEDGMVFDSEQRLAVLDALQEAMRARSSHKSLISRDARADADGPERA